MTSFRRRLSCVFGIWLVFQVAAIVAPVAMAAAGFASVEEFCECPAEGHGATCPMHHTRTRRVVTPAEDDCRLQNACAPADAALLSLLGGAGLLPPAVPVHHVEFSSDDLTPTVVAAAERDEVPDAPPPRS